MIDETQGTDQGRKSSKWTKFCIEASSEQVSAVSFLLWSVSTLPSLSKSEIWRLGIDLNVLITERQIINRIKSLNLEEDHPYRSHSDTFSQTDYQIYVEGTPNRCRARRKLVPSTFHLLCTIYGERRSSRPTDWPQKARSHLTDNLDDAEMNTPSPSWRWETPSRPSSSEVLKGEIGHLLQQYLGDVELSVTNIFCSGKLPGLSEHRNRF